MRNFIFLCSIVLFTSVLAKNCPDASHCTDDETCCELTTGKFGCCPLPNAVCCSDKIHCCPENTKCNVQNGTCDQMLEPIRRSLITASLNRIENIICPDGKEQCLDNQTCCKLQSGDYGCCPYEQGVCCSDEQHCCPNGFACDVRHSRCIHPKSKTYFIPKPKVMARLNGTVNSVVCPDQSQCPDNNTCCPMEGGEYGCCPLNSAVCCADKVHCCPNGTQCVGDVCERR